MIEALHAHLDRLLVWGALSVVAGLALRRRPFGIMTGAWGAVNVVIVLATWRNVPHEPDFHAFLAFNLGLDLGYVGVGLAMALLAGDRTRIKEFGGAIVIQGAMLFLLDAFLFLQNPIALDIVAGHVR